MTETTTPANEAIEARRGHGARWAALAVGVVLLVLIAVLATSRTLDSRGISSKLLGQPVPPVAGETIDGGRFDIDDYRGRWVVVNYFATWCVPCQQEHPELVEFAERHAATGDAVVVSVAFSDQPDRHPRVLRGQRRRVVGDRRTTRIAPRCSSVSPVCRSRTW